MGHSVQSPARIKSAHAAARHSATDGNGLRLVNTHRLKLATSPESFEQATTVSAAIKIETLTGFMVHQSTATGSRVWANGTPADREAA